MRFRAWRSSVFILSVLPLLFWGYEAATNQLGVDPGKRLVDLLGLTALWFLLLTLAMTPLKTLSGWAGWVAVRRQLGLWCYAYALMHMLGYVAFLLELDLSRLLHDLYKRPYIIVGAFALAGLSLLAITSNKFSIRRLGRRWKRLHRGVYAILFLVLLHMLWVVRADMFEWAGYAVVGVLLMAIRLSFLSEAVSCVLARLKDSLWMVHCAFCKISKKR